MLLGVQCESLLQDIMNSGGSLEGVLGFVIVLPTIAFLAARSAIGFARWRLQRELWRRDVERLS